MQYEKDRLTQELQRCNGKSLEQCISELMAMLELSDPAKYRSKFRGVQIHPFHMKDLSYRVQKLPDDILQKRMKMKVRPANKSAEELKKKVQQMKNERLKRANDREMSVQQEQREKDRKMGKMFSDSESVTSRITTKLEKPKGALDTLLSGATNEVIQENEEMSKQKKPGHPIYITLNDLDKMNVKQFNRNVRVDFKPTDFLLDSDEDELGKLT